MRKALDIIAFAAAVLMATAGFILIRNNFPAFSPALPSLLLWTIYFFLFPLIGLTHLRREPGKFTDKDTLVEKIIQTFLFLLGAAGLLYSFLNAALIDYYQPFSLFDTPIYIMLISWVIFIALFIFQAVRSAMGRFCRRGFLIWPMLTLILFAIVPVFTGLSTPQWSDSIESHTVLFNGGEDGYKSFRIPGLVSIPAGSRLADETVNQNDIVLAFAEARKRNSLDHGDIDLVMRRSTDSGQTWSDMTIVRHWDDGLGKIGDPTPVYDSARGVLILAMGAQAHGEPYETWLMESKDGGQSWSDPLWLGTGSPGPGHGDRIVGGQYDGRLVIPAHKGNDGFVWLSDDGTEWRASRDGYQGNESLIAAAGDGKLAYTGRVPFSVAKPHPRLEKLFGMSLDGGDTWEGYPDSGVVTPICMSGFVGDGEGSLWFVNPATVRTRARLSLRRSDNGGRSWSDTELLYPGPAGYADLALGSNNTLYVLAKNGRVEYDERITFATLGR